MNKKYFLINLNQGESKEARQESNRERLRWIVFSLIVFFFLFINGAMLWINYGYNNLIEKKHSEISQVTKQLAELQSRGKNISKVDITSLAEIEEYRFMWAPVLEAMSELNPEDIAITSLTFKFDKWMISGIASIYEDIKDFDIVNQYVNKLRNHSKFADNFSRIKFTEYSRQNFRGQEIIQFKVSANVSSKPKQVGSK
ncbi:MAG: PilN domain-containing protein [Candidatus Marinimicrobia bacterium]|nr:PilN domain-containing protein [Candidatus Neomarinimicrobiota bacterium]